MVLKTALRIDWFITRKCDQASFCRFCYAPWNFFPPDVSVERALEICDRLKDLGTDTVTMCGGEPFMYPGLDQVIRKLHALGIKVVLYTSGTSNCYDVKEFLPWIDFLSLPVDAVSPEVILKMRGSSQFERISHILEMLKGRSQRPKIKVGTVVTKQNIGDLAQIGDFLHALGIVDVWRLYEFSPYGIGKHNEKRYLLKAGEFEQAVQDEKARDARRDDHRSLIAPAKPRGEHGLLHNHRLRRFTLPLCGKIHPARRLNQ